MKFQLTKILFFLGGVIVLNQCSILCAQVNSLALPPNNYSDVDAVMDLLAKNVLSIVINGKTNSCLFLNGSFTDEVDVDGKGLIMNQKCEDMRGEFELDSAGRFKLEYLGLQTRWIDGTKPYFKQNETIAYDGNKAFLISLPLSDSAEIKLPDAPLVTIGSLNAVEFDYNKLHTGQFFVGTSITSGPASGYINFVRSISSANGLEVSRTPDGSTRYKISGTLTRGGTDRTISTQFVIKNLVITFYESVENAISLPSKTTRFSVEKVQNIFPGLDFPRSAKLEEYIGGVLKRRYTLLLKQVEVREVKEDDFKIILPKGSQVTDERLGISYDIGPDDLEIVKESISGK